MATVSFEGVTKKFGDTVAVNDFTLQVEDGEFMVLVGPSGCGKTTVLRLVAGLEQPGEGEIRIDGKPVNDLSPRDRDVAMVFQSYALYPHMNVYDNMAFGLRNRKVPRPNIERRVAQAAAMLGLDNLLRRKPRELSGGQRQRVALGRAIVREPKAFLMDEPLSNLDAKLRVQTRAELIRLHRKLGVTTIYVTHDQGEAMTMGNRIAVLRDGVLQQVGPPLEVYARPANLFVAGFVGSPTMNFVPVRVVQEGGALALSNDSLKILLPTERSGALSGYLGRETVLGIRPEDISVSAGLAATTDEQHQALLPSRGPGGHALRALVEVVEPLGASCLLYLKVGKETLVASVPAETPAVEGGHLHVMVDGSNCHLFDKDTEMAIL